MQGQPRYDGDREDFDDESPRDVGCVEIFSKECNREDVDYKGEHRGKDHLPVWTVDLQRFRLKLYLPLNRH